MISHFLFFCYKFGFTPTTEPDIADILKSAIMFPRVRPIVLPTFHYINYSDTPVMRGVVLLLHVRIPFFFLFRVTLGRPIIIW